MNNKITKAEKVTSTSVEKGNVFIDYDKNGNVIPWVDRKHQVTRYAEVLSHINDYASMNGYDFKVSRDQVQRVHECGEYREYKSYVNAKTKDVMDNKLHRAFFCKRRLCPQCMWLRTLSESHINGLALTAIHEDHKSAYGYFLTLTVKNVDGPRLSDEITHIASSFTKLMRKTRIKKYLLGYSRAIEVTYNKEKDTYHPHIHAILIFKSSLRNSEGGIFKQSKKNGQNEFIDMWQDAAGLDYRPSITIEQYTKAKTYIGKYGKHKGKRIHKSREENIMSSAYELTKYPSKISDSAKAIPIYEESTQSEEKTIVGYDFQYDLEKLFFLERGYYNKRLMTYGGIVKEYRTKVKKRLLEEAIAAELQDEYEFTYTDGNGKEVHQKLTEEDILYNYFRVRFNHAEKYQDKAFVVSEIDQHLTAREFEAKYGYKKTEDDDDLEIAKNIL